MDLVVLNPCAEVFFVEIDDDNSLDKMVSGKLYIEYC